MQEGDEVAHRPLSSRTPVNWPLALIALFMLPAGLQASISPRSFFDDFPAGRGWVAATGGPYNEHLVRDVGVLFVALVVPTLWTAWTREGDRAVAVAWIIQGVAHLGFHAAHLDHLSGGDQIGLIASLVIVVVLAITATLYPTGRPADRSPR